MMMVHAENGDVIGCLGQGSSSRWQYQSQLARAWPVRIREVYNGNI
ncbi:MAG: hypothetical protein R2880_16265 [Deinococcales bacterium]